MQVLDALQKLRQGLLTLPQAGQMGLRRPKMHVRAGDLSPIEAHVAASISGCKQLRALGHQTPY